jgi:PPK2 family polyphosphate:nucleotide phosphotransferase
MTNSKNRDTLLDQCHKLAKAYRVADGDGFRLASVDPNDTLHLDRNDKEMASQRLSEGTTLLAEFQERLYAQDRWGMLLIFQAMDAAGKDGTIKHVMSGVNPQGCQVTSFKAPSPTELDHDYLWRCQQALPERGRIGIFNRSYYEETLVVRVHPELLQKQQLPSTLLGDDLWKQRCRDILHFEEYLSNNGFVVLKFFLHVSRQEQKRRFLDRLDNPEKNWKFSLNDIHERAHWDAYMAAYEETIQRTARSHAPWYVVPADNKWFTRIAVAASIIDAMARLDLRLPHLSDEARRQLEEGRRLLMAEAA